jgi:hypothetical protein
MQLLKKVAFMVHEPTMFAHYSSVWAEMDRNSFVIVLLGVFSDSENGEHGTGEFLSKVDRLGYTTVYLADIVARNIKYEYVVSNHILSGRSPHPGSPYQLALHNIKNLVKRSINVSNRMFGRDKRFDISNLDPVQYPPLQAGIKQIRFMYGADISDAWSLDAWNEIYDLFLCHGPNDETHLKKRFKGKTAIMGYPRYDLYFSEALDLDEVVEEFGIDPNKKTILWMPTWDILGDGVCSIVPFARAISGLTDDFNVIVRPHPISIRKDPDAIKLLVSLKYRIDVDSTRDMNKLFKVADFVLCDHGGSAFGALYLGKNLVLLKTPKYDESLMAKNSSNLELMKYFPTITVSEVDSLRSLFNDTVYWQKVLEDSRQLSDKYFADYRGTSSAAAATALGQLVSN